MADYHDIDACVLNLHNFLGKLRIPLRALGYEVASECPYLQMVQDLSHTDPLAKQQKVVTNILKDLINLMSMRDKAKVSSNCIMILFRDSSGFFS
jgi:hypothetical protein